MKATTLFAPAALAVGFFSLYSTDAQANEPVPVVAAVALPPLVVTAGGVQVAVGVPPPQQVVVVREREPERVVYIRERERYYPPRETIVVVEDDCHGHKHPKGKAHGYWKKHKHHGHYR